MTPDSWGLAAVVGIVVLGVAVARRWLTPPAVLAAAGMGIAIGVGLGLPGLSALLFFFVSSSWLTLALRGGARGERPRSVQVPGPGSISAPSGVDPAEGVREGDARGRRPGQVLANAGAAAIWALLAPLVPDGLAAAGASGALAAATADTWASEIGQWRRARTRLITTGRRVAPGTSGGVSWPGSIAGTVGALALGLVAGFAFRAPLLGAAAAAGGVAGMLVDSVAGATLERERGWLGNDGVNWLGTIAGAAAAALLVGS